MVTRRKEVATPAEWVEKLLLAAQEDAVLVGVLALGFWAQRYGMSVPPGHVTISNDVDFLGRAATAAGLVRRLADALQGHASFPSEHALTALVGQAFREVGDDEFINVDVLHKVVGLRCDQVRGRAVRVELARGGFFWVMHPLHVLRSRLMNLHKLPEKQNAKGQMQLALAIDVAREHLRQVALQSAPSSLARGRSPLQPLVAEIERLALQDAGRKVALRHGLHVADAIDPAQIPPGPFWSKKWPSLKTLMSPTYAAGITPRLPAARHAPPAP